MYLRKGFQFVFDPLLTPVFFLNPNTYKFFNMDIFLDIVYRQNVQRPEILVMVDWA